MPDPNPRVYTKIILGIHSDAASNSNAGDGHAWISIRSPGTPVRTIGLWADFMPQSIVPNDFTDRTSDIFTGREISKKPVASRYYLLSEAQAVGFDRLLALHKLDRTQWNYTTNCASFASGLVYELLGEDVDADDGWMLGAETPRELTASIMALEAKTPTSLVAPRRLRFNPLAELLKKSKASVDRLRRRQEDAQRRRKEFQRLGKEVFAPPSGGRHW